jgi:two-component system OmpR family sensor kinase
MTIMLMSTDLLERFFDRGAQDEEALRTIEGLRVSVNQMNVILEHMLDSAVQHDDAPMHLEPELIPLRSFISNIIRGASIAAAMSGVRVLNEVPEGLSIVGDPSWLGRVFQNLLTNALIHSSGRTVSIGAGEDGMDGVVCYVCDDGKGMSCQAISNSLDGERREPGARHGLGLLAVKSIVHAHSGSLRISAQEGEGTTIYVSLPASSVLLL